MKVTGLTSEEVLNRTNKGLVNYNTDVKTKSIKMIVTTNFLTLFNFLNLALGLAIFLVGEYKNLLFLGVAICNTLISTVQEIRSKLIVDKLSLLNVSTVTVLRDGKESEISVNEIVLDDVCRLKAGSQIATDSKIISGEVLVNESLITGESEPISKKTGDNLLSGSFIVSGWCYAKTIHVGADNYTAKISAEAKYIKKANSEIMNFIKKIIKIISICIIPLGILMFIHQLNLPGNTFSEAVVSTVASLIGMIPEGLVLLTSTVLAISVIRLSKEEVLVQDLYCIETLARVDTICLDKTGTLTKGVMKVDKLIPLNGSVKEIEDALGHMSFYMANDNATMEAISNKYLIKSQKEVKKIIPFSSDRKWSGITFDDESYILGAPEIVCSDNSLKDKIDNYTEDSRVVLLAKSKKVLNNIIPNDIIPLAFILISDEIKLDAKITLEYFKAQDVTLKLISGDNPKTVAGVAKKVGFDNVKYIDMSRNKKLISDIVEEYNVFGRVKPDEKKALIIALKEKGHTVAMTGDGVNDVLALKEADCSIAMNSGSDAARNVAQIVLLDSNFSAMPKVLGEGRRSINNLQRSSSLFLCKTTYATLLALIFLFLNKNYPFIPIQLTLTSVLTIGIPSFILALEPNNDRINGRIIINVLKKSLPTALTIVSNIVILSFLPSLIRLSSAEVSTLAVALTAFTGFMLLYRISVPFNALRRILFVFLLTAFVIAFTFFKPLFSLETLGFDLLLLLAILLMVAFTLFNFYFGVCNKLVNKIKFKE